MTTSPMRAKEDGKRKKSFPTLKVKQDNDADHGRLTTNEDQPSSGMDQTTGMDWGITMIKQDLCQIKEDFKALGMESQIHFQQELFDRNRLTTEEQDNSMYLDDFTPFKEIDNQSDMKSEMNSVADLSLWEKQ